MQAIVHHPFCPREQGRAWEGVYFALTLLSIGSSAAHLALFHRHRAALANTLNYLLCGLMACHLVGDLAPALLIASSLLDDEQSTPQCVALHVWIVFFRLAETCFLAVYYLHMFVLVMRGERFAAHYRLLRLYTALVLAAAVAAGVMAYTEDRTEHTRVDVFSSSTEAQCVCEVSPSKRIAPSPQAFTLLAANILAVVACLTAAALTFGRLKQMSERDYVSRKGLFLRWSYVAIPLALVVRACLLYFGTEETGHAAEDHDTMIIARMIIRGCSAPFLLAIFYWTEVRVPGGSADPGPAAALVEHPQDGGGDDMAEKLPPPMPRNAAYGGTATVGAASTAGGALKPYRLEEHTLSYQLNRCGERYYCPAVVYTGAADTRNSITNTPSRRSEA
jgi:hypothetical protein